MEIREELTQRATEYFESIEELKGKVPPPMLVDFVIEKYIQVRNISHYNETKRNEDMKACLSTMAMAVVDIFMKIGAEGETSHSENGIGRDYENAYISLSIFSDILPKVRSLGK